MTPRARPGPRRTARSAGRGGTALLYRGLIGTRRTVAAGLLQSTSLPFIVSASVIGVDLGVISAATSAALVGAGPVSVVVFPLPAAIVIARPSVARPEPAPRRVTVRAS